MYNFVIPSNYSNNSNYDDFSQSIFIFYQQRFSFKGGKSFYSYKSLLFFKGSSYQFLMVFFKKTCFGLKGAYDFHLHSIRTKDCQKQSPRGVLRNFAKFTGKHLCQSLYFNKVAGLRPVNFAKFLRTPFLQNSSG